MTQAQRIAEMFNIDTYTGDWNAALRPSPPDIGTKVLVAPCPDGREIDEFLAVLRAAGLRLEYDSPTDEEAISGGLLDLYTVEQV